MTDPLAPRPIDLPTPVPLEPGADLRSLDEAKILAAPADPAFWPIWRERLRAWRADAARRTGYDGAVYEHAEAGWTQSCYSVSIVWLWDETLYDHQAGVFTPDDFLDAARRDYEGFDAVVLWHAYPVIGVDDRNQFDFYRQVPGLAELVAAFRRRGVRVFLDYNPWDTGTRRPARGDADELAELVRELDADGVFLDTLKEGVAGLRDALDAARGGVALEGESRVPLARITDHQLSWAQWFADSPVPGVLRARWFEPRHQMHQTRRWNRDHSDELHTAWLNGAGMLVWDVVFGSWVGWNERDRSFWRAMLPVLRRYQELFTAGAWSPLSGTPQGPGPVFASQFSLGDTTLWTMVNRDPHPWTGPLLDPGPVADPGTEPLRWFDLIAGREIDRGLGMIRGALPARGVGAILAIPAARVDADLEDFLKQQAAHTLSADTDFSERPVLRVPAPLTRRARLPEAMIALPHGPHRLTVRYRLRETGLYSGAPYVNDWKPLPPRLHQDLTELRDVHIGRVAVARREVTNAQYAEFLAASGYRPARPERFLGHWADVGPQGRPASAPDAPVTHIDIADARAYATWAGLRLPTEDEWQIAAAAGLLDRAEPLVWNWTESEHYDGRTRFVILKGGSAFRPDGSDWYLDGGPLPPEVSVKLLLCGASVARSAGIGFRCAVDLADVELGESR